MALYFRKQSMLWRTLTLLLWMGVIFSFSTMQGSSQAFDPPLWYYLERKGAHVFEYAILLLLSLSFFRGIFPKESLFRVLLLSSFFSIMYAMTDELHQFFVPYRGARMSDVLIDSVSVLVTASLFFVLYCKQGKKP
ncbi:MAG: VanZ family protein [Candidatus Moranbacteria bacterium]|nr:VanZ family protein [Candidatus Moranbacteria bacterium]OIQ03079.1 MAG: hypothetical protein AUK58_02110 [Candidatus Moranbacteria bacterium CG2_30_41_165]